MITEVLINGEVSDGRIPVTDSSVLRGDACFEVIKVYGGRVFTLDEHIGRLQRSSSALGIELPDREKLIEWIEHVASSLGDGAVRIVVTRGASVPGLDEPSRVIVFGHPWTPGEREASLAPVEAPWHAAGVPWDLAGAKITSYAPNMAATRRAKADGFDDALLVTTDGIILEGPTFSVAWVADGVLETPTLELGILDSITRRVVLSLANDAGLELVEGRFKLDRLDAASEVMAWSTIREVQAVVAVGDRSWQLGPVTDDLAERFRQVTG